MVAGNGQACFQINVAPDVEINVTNGARDAFQVLNRRIDTDLGVFLDSAPGGQRRERFLCSHLFREFFEFSSLRVGHYLDFWIPEWFLVRIGRNVPCALVRLPLITVGDGVSQRV